MAMVLHRIVVLPLVLANVVTLGGFESPLTRAALEEAVEIGQTRMDAMRARFNLPYQVPVNRPPIDYIEVVTPFRRVALAAETRARQGLRGFGQTDALAVLGTMPERIDLIVELTFHPLNTYIGVPAYSVSLAPVEPRPRDVETGRAAFVEPLELARISRSGPRVLGMPLPYPYVTGPQPIAGSEPVVGGTLIAQFDGRRLAAGTYDAVIAEGGKELARAPIALGRLR